MLNDLHAIERGLATAGISTTPRHPDMKDMAKGWAICVRLAASGSIDEIELIPEAGRGNVWTLRDGQHNGFPGLKTGGALLALDQDMIDRHNQNWNGDKQAPSRRAELLRLLSQAYLDMRQVAAWPSAAHRKRIVERLNCLRELAHNPETASVPAAFERFLKALDGSSPFLEQLLSAVTSKLHRGADDWLEPARTLLLGPAPLAIDVPIVDFPRNAGDRRQVSAVSIALNGDPAPPIHDEYQCAFSGKSAKLHSGNFPQPNLPGLGQSYVFSRNSDIPSLARYGRSADMSFSIDSGLVLRLAGVFDVLTSEDRKGNAWRLIPPEAGDKPDLLLVSLPQAMTEPLADALAEDVETIGGETRLNELAARVITTSKGNDGDAPDDMIVLVLRAVDPANRKAIYHRRMSATALSVAAEYWQRALRNLPDWISLPLPVKGQKQLVQQRPFSVTPLSITPISRVLYANGGRRKVDVAGTTSAAAFALFLRDGDVTQRARQSLRLLVARHGPLLAGIAAARAKGTEHLKAFDPSTDLRRDALKSVTWIGSLLYNCNRAKERYMSETAFRLGQLLAAADTIHVGYCADLRGGDVPPTLLGNSVLTVAGADPLRALAILQTRIKPYLGWARRVEHIHAKADTVERDGNTGGAIALRRAVSHARRAGNLARDLHLMLQACKETKTDDAFKAEILLGYLAGLEPLAKRKGSSEDTDESTNDHTEENQE